MLMRWYQVGGEEILSGEVEIKRMYRNATSSSESASQRMVVS